MPTSSWTTADDNALIALVEEYTLQAMGTPHASLWKRVAERLGHSRTPAVCRSRWSLFDPHVVQSDWTEAEDLALIESVRTKPIASIGWSRRAAELAVLHRYGGARRRLGQDVCRRWVKVLQPRCAPLLAHMPLAGVQKQMHVSSTPPGHKDYSCCVRRRSGGGGRDHHPCVVNAVLTCAPTFDQQRCAKAATMHSESVIYVPSALANYSRYSR
jgi:hypothetical protein